MRIHLDFETYSEADLLKVGAEKYAEHPSTEILFIGWRIDDDPIESIYYPSDSEAAKPLFDAIRSLRPGDRVVAHNYRFEKAIWEKVGMDRLAWPSIPKSCWHCTAVRARAAGFNGSLAGALKAINHKASKLDEGRRLIIKYSKPYRGARQDLAQAPDDLAAFMDYNIRDVELECILDDKLPQLSSFEEEVFQLDMQINDRGVPIDMACVENLSGIIDRLGKAYEEEALSLAGISTNQVARMVELCQSRGLDIPDMTAGSVKSALKTVEDSFLKRLLEIRYDFGRSGPKKIKRIRQRLCSSGRIEGAFMLHGADATGRWSSRGVQFHSFGRTPFHQQTETLDAAAKGFEVFRSSFPMPMDRLSGALRGVIAAEPGHRLIAADFSAIEARVVAWLSQEDWLLDAYEQGEDAYRVMASKIYKKPVRAITDSQRFFGKTTILGAGFGMGPARFQAACSQFGVNISLPNAKKIIDLYRQEAGSVKDTWDAYNNMCIKAVQHPGKVTRHRNVRFKSTGNMLYIMIPSGRCLSYHHPRVKPGVYGLNIYYDKQLSNAWVEASLYGGLIMQNITQATARDILAHALLTVDKAGYEIVMHVHDEIITMMPEGQGSAGELCELMCRLPAWTKDDTVISRALPMAAEGWENRTWRK